MLDEFQADHRFELSQIAWWLLEVYFGLDASGFESARKLSGTLFSITAEIRYRTSFPRATIDHHLCPAVEHFTSYGPCRYSWEYIRYHQCGCCRGGELHFDD
jgi:hypothetical protein